MIFNNLSSAFGKSPWAVNVLPLPELGRRGIAGNGTGNARAAKFDANNHDLKI